MYNRKCSEAQPTNIGNHTKQSPDYNNDDDNSAYDLICFSKSDTF
jgi:hypothetical protein